MKGGKKTTGDDRFTKLSMTDFVRNATHAPANRQRMKLNRCDNNEERRKTRRKKERRDNATRDETD